MTDLDVTIAIINYNTKAWLDSCLNSIVKAPPLAAFEILVVDNGSTDDSVEYVKGRFPEVQILENAGNLGYAGAANQALRTSRAKYVLILNTDTELDSEAVDILTEFADAHEEVGIVGPLLLNTDGSIQVSGRRFPSFLDATMHAFLGHIWPKNPYSLRYRMLDWDRRTGRPVDWVSGAAMLIRRSAAEEVSLFDDGFFMYVEDVDLCYRMWQRGWKVFFWPEAKIIHHSGKTSRQSSAKMIVEFQRSLYRFYSKTYSHTWKRRLKPLVAAGLVGRAAVLISWDWLSGWFNRPPKETRE
jgi:GT2 family glycosyltransferase